MAISAGERVFVDTNVLVHASAITSPLHESADRELQNARRAQAELWTSRQVLREYVAALSRPQSFSRPVSVSTLIADIRYFQSVFHIADEDSAVTAELLQVLASVSIGGKQVHDANIVATMRAHRIATLLTENVSVSRDLLR
jgi:predicted nucleic acid-binding protein